MNVPLEVWLAFNKSFSFPKAVKKIIRLAPDLKNKFSTISIILKLLSLLDETNVLVDQFEVREHT